MARVRDINIYQAKLDVEGEMMGAPHYNGQKPVALNGTGKARDELSIWAWGLDLGNEIMHRWNRFEQMQKALEAMVNGDPKAMEKVKRALNKARKRKPVILD